MDIVQSRLYSTKQVAEMTGVPATSIALLVAQGLLAPSERRGVGRGHGHAWQFCDVAAARILKVVHTPQATAPPLRALAEFCRTEEGAGVIATLWATRGKNTKSHILIATDQGPAQLGLETEKGEVYVDVATDEGAERVRKPLARLLEGCAVAYAVNLNRVISELNVPETEVVLRFAPPDPATGRVPPEPKARNAKAEPLRGPRLPIEEGRRQRRNGTKENRKSRGTGK